MSNFLLLLILLSLLSSTAAAILQHELHWRESLKTKLVRQGLWKDYVAQKQSLLHGKSSNFKSVSQNIDDHEYLEYYVNITVGTPEQLFIVIFDTAVGNMVIPDVNCGSCQSVRKFNSSKSSTYQKTDHYLYNSPAFGVYGQDFVRFGNPGTDQLVVPKAMFGQTLIGVETGIFGGVIGLGFTTETVDMVDSPITTAIKSGILDNPIVTLFLRDQRTSSLRNNGVITYGAIDTVNCDRNIVYEPLANPSAFVISMNKAALGSSQFSGKWQTFIATASYMMFGPKSIVQAFIKEVNATFNNEFGLYTVDCNVQFNLNLTIGSTTYTLTEKEMVVDYINNSCVFGLLALETDEWNLGYPWLRGFCNVLDYGNKRIGFAKVLNP